MNKKQGEEGMGSKVFSLFNMFDKVDDIIYAPVNAVCDWIRQPLEQIKLGNDRKKAEHAQQMTMELEKFREDLEIERKRKEMELSLEEREKNAEIDNMIHEAAMQQQEAMMQMEMKYRTELAELNARMTKLMSDNLADSIRILFTLIEEKNRSYLEIQTAYRKELTDTVRELRELGTDKEVTQPFLIDGLKKITGKSSDFEKMLCNCVEEAIVIINEDAELASKRMDEYFRTRENEPSLLQKNIDILEQNVR